jgi:hypothetical protein
LISECPSNCWIVRRPTFAASKWLAKTDAQGKVIKKDPKRHEVWLSDNFNTIVFIGWHGKLFNKSRIAPIYNFHFTVDKLFNAVDLVARGRNAAYTESRTFNFRAAVSHF